MKSLKLSNWFVLATILFALTALLMAGIKYSDVSVQAQSEKKTVTVARTANSQLEFSDLKVGLQNRNSGEGFDSDPEWVKDLSFNLKNSSDKSIVYLKVNINFPETRSTGNLMSYGINFGARPGLQSKFNTPLSLKPGETLEIALDKEKEKLYKFLSGRQPIESIKKVELEIGYIIFEDKTAWTAGTFLRQDPANPSRYNPVDAKQLQTKEVPNHEN